MIQTNATADTSLRNSGVDQEAPSRLTRSLLTSFLFGMRSLSARNVGKGSAHRALAMEGFRRERLQVILEAQRLFAGWLATSCRGKTAGKRKDLVRVRASKGFALLGTLPLRNKR